MLKLRLSRTGKNTQPTFRLIVQEHTAPIKGKFVEELGYYKPTTPDKPFTINSERVKYWISVGATPSDTVATLLKKQGIEGMEKYMEPRDKKRKSRAAAEQSEAEAPKQKEAQAKKEEPAPAAENVEPKEAPAPAPENVEPQQAAESAAEEAKAQSAPEAPAEESPKSES